MKSRLDDKMTLAVAESILLRACDITNLTPDDLRSKSRKAPISRVRFAIMYAVRRRTEWSFPMIASFLCLKDHSSVIYAVKEAPKIYARDAGFAALVAELMFAPWLMPALVEPAPIVLPATARPKHRKEIMSQSVAISSPPIKLRRDRNWFALPSRHLSMLREGSAKLAMAINDARRGTNHGL